VPRANRGHNAYDRCLELSPVIISAISWLRHQKAVSSIYDIMYNAFQAQQKIDGSRQRPYDTVEPLAEDLGLSVDTSCDRDDQDCVADVVESYNGSGNILICWEHDALHDIVKALGDKNAPDYPDDSYVKYNLDIHRSIC
jgi:hypothetical protein